MVVLRFLPSGAKTMLEKPTERTQIEENVRLRSLRKGLALWHLAGPMGLAIFAIAFTAIVVGGDKLAPEEDPLRAFLYGRHRIQPEDCGVVLSAVPPGLGPGAHYEARVVLAVDNSWLAKFGEDAERQARSVLEDAAPLFRPFGIQLVAATFVRWRSDHLPASSDQLLAEVKRSVDLEGADVVLGLTGLHLHGGDGRAYVGGRYALVGHHPGHPERDRLVAAHELGHLLGARDTPAGSGRGTLMAKTGFDHNLEWSSCHERLLKLNASRFE